MNNVASPRKVLGRGLESLLNPTGREISAVGPASSPAGDSSAVRMVEVGAISANPFQPRSQFKAAALEELAASIRLHGLLQPLLLRPAAAGYQIVAGERRWRAAQMAGLARVPATIQTISDARALELAIIENLQREDLNPMEQARAFHQLATQFQLTQEDIAERTGKDRATVANFLRLLKLDPEVQKLVELEQLSMGHARALAALAESEQKTWAERVVGQGWSVRRLERALGGRDEPQGARSKSSRPKDPNVAAAEDELARALGLKISVKDHNGAGVIAIAYSDLKEFQRVYDRLTR